MHSSEEPKRDFICGNLKQEHSHTILFNILNHKDICALEGNGRSLFMHSCHCEQRRSVCLRNPERTCQEATDVLLKTMGFIKSLPSFHHLPGLDQFLLLRSHWVPLFVLGLAQEHIIFEVSDFPTTSILRGLLLHANGDQKADKFLPNLAAVNNLRSCLEKIWSLKLTPNEYAYLKGTILFNPDVPGLINRRLIEWLQKEAQRLLYRDTHKLLPNEYSRLTSILLTASSLHTVAQNFVTKLFFRDVIGQTGLLKLLTDTFHYTERSLAYVTAFKRF